MGEGCPLTAAPPDLECGAAPLGPPAPAQPTAVPIPGCTHLEGGLFSAPGCLWVGGPGRSARETPAPSWSAAPPPPGSLLAWCCPSPTLALGPGALAPPLPAPAPPAGTPSRPYLPPLGLPPALSPSCLLSLSVCPAPPQCCCPRAGRHPQARDSLGSLLGVVPARGRPRPVAILESGGLSAGPSEDETHFPCLSLQLMDVPFFLACLRQLIKAS